MSKNDEESRARIESLRAALIEGETSGASRRFDFDAFIERKRLSGRPATRHRHGRARPGHL